MLDHTQRLRMKNCDDNDDDCDDNDDDDNEDSSVEDAGSHPEAEDEEGL